MCSDASGYNSHFTLTLAGAHCDRLEDIGLVRFVKISGGEGLHVVVPLRSAEGDPGWNEDRAFCQAITNRMVCRESKSYIATTCKQKRGGKIVIDYLRNGRADTSVAPYSVRAHAGAPVSTPIRWDELTPITAGGQYTVNSLVRRMAQLGDDRWDGFHSTHLRLTRTCVESLIEKYPQNNA